MVENQLTDWKWVQFNDVNELWEAQPTYLISQGVYVLAGLLTFIHALKKGGRWPWFWLGALLHGFFSDNFWHVVLPSYDNFWHSRTPVMFLGGRLPLHIILLYPVFMYHAAYAVSKLNLPKLAEPFTVGLLCVLIDIPYDIVAVKFVHWTWHDTDPNIFDRHYWVPFNSYYFHAAFAASFTFFFHQSRQWFAPKLEKWTASGAKKELWSLLISSLLGMPGGVLMFIPLYHPLHDVLKIHTEVITFALLSLFTVITLVGLLSTSERVKAKLTAIDYVLVIQLVLHYLTYWLFVVLGSPENERSYGTHEPVGPCNEVTALTSPLGQDLYKRKYLCLESYDEGYYDFHCARQLPKAGDSWYLICGTPFENRSEYITILTTILICAFGVFYGIYFRGAASQEKPTKKQKTK